MQAYACNKQHNRCIYLILENFFFCRLSGSHNNACIVACVVCIQFQVFNSLGTLHCVLISIACSLLILISCSEYYILIFFSLTICHQSRAHSHKILATDWIHFFSFESIFRGPLYPVRPPPVLAPERFRKLSIDILIHMRTMSDLVPTMSFFLESKCYNFERYLGTYLRSVALVPKRK